MEYGEVNGSNQFLRLSNKEIGQVHMAAKGGLSCFQEHLGSLNAADKSG
jgi:hypothetical protein